MELQEVLAKRKSTRSYTGEQITDDELNEILKAANYAPVGGGHFDQICLTVVQDKDILNEINANVQKSFGNANMVALYGAPTLIIISHLLPEDHSSDWIAYSDTACLFENMTLKATELNIGSCAIWGATNALKGNPDLVKKLNLPEGFLPCGSIILGKTNDTFPEREETLTKIKTNFIK